MPPFLLRRLLISVLALMPLPALAGTNAGDPFFGEALFHAYQGNYFEALERLDSELAQHYRVDEPILDSLYPQVDDAEFSVGDFELRYRMHARAGRAIRAVLEGDVDEAVRADAAFRLAQIHFQKGQSRDALKVLESIAAPTDTRLRDDIQFLRANVLLALNRPNDAITALLPLQDSSAIKGFSAYNLGIALLEHGDAAAAAIQLNRAGKLRAQNREDRAIRDKSNLVLGTMLQEAGDFGRARAALERIRLAGPYSNQALLRAGWSEVSAEQFERAVVPWKILAERDSTDPAVQEAKLALPFAYSKLNVFSRAAVLYEQAVNSFGGEIHKLDASVASIDRGEFLEALEREEIRQDKDWVIRLRSLPDAPETFYLVSLMASHEFQTSLQNYLDLAELRRKLLGWQNSLAAFEDIIRIRGQYFGPRIPEIDQQFRKLDAQMRVRLEQRRHLDERLTKMLISPAPDLLATSEEHAIKNALEALSNRIDARPEKREVDEARIRIARLSGILKWRLEGEYHERLTDSHNHLRELNADVGRLEAQYDTFVRTRQAASHSYLGYDKTIARLREQVAESLIRLTRLREQQGEMLESVARRELRLRRERLEDYQNQARFAFADSYDRAAKQRAQ
jgi:predicted negative regulator of RcsB-dependent stress response